MQHALDRRARAVTAATATLALLTAFALTAGLLVMLLRASAPDLADGRPVAVAAGGQGAPSMVVCGTPLQEPSTFPMRCGSGAVTLNNVRWSTWTARTASAVGEYWILNPSGAAATYPVRVEVSEPTGSGRAHRFSQLALTFAGRPPAGHDRVVVYTARADRYEWKEQAR